MTDEHYPYSRTENQSDPERLRIFESGSQWRWLQWLHGRFSEDRWRKRERYLAERERYNRLHLGGVFIKGNAGLDR